MMKPNNQNNFINFGYGYPEVNEYQKTEIKHNIPFYSLKTRVPVNKQIFALPYAIAPDERFVYLSELVVQNTMNRYIISNYGRLFDTSLNKFVPYRFNKPYNVDGSNNGYYIAHISHFIDPYTLESTDAYIHHAVLLSFVQPPVWKFEIDHINMVKTDNRLCNLRYVTPEDNKRLAKAKIELAANYYGYKRNSITEEDAHNICRLYSQGYETYDIANNLHIEFYTVLAVLSGAIFKHIYLQYNFAPISSTYSIPEEAIHKICKFLQDGKNISDIAVMTGIDKYFILNIKNRKIYQDISINYDFSKSEELDGFRRTLPNNAVHEICRRLSLGEGPAQIARDFNVDKSVVANIKARKNYTEISAQYSFERINADKIPDNMVHSICKEFEKGERDYKIAEKYNVDRGLVSRIRRKEVYTDISSLYNFQSSRDLDPERELDNDTVHMICKRLAAGESELEVVKATGIRLSLVHSIKSKASYLDISSQYEFPRLSVSISEDQIKTACKGLQRGDRTSKILSDANISKRTLYRLRDRERYTDISKDYKW